MPKIEFSLETPLRAEDVLGAATDFTERRPVLWPGIDPKAYRVHSVGEHTADVTEGSAVMGGIWAREHYEWTANEVTARVQESNVFRPGGIWRMTVSPGKDGGARVQILNDRQTKGAKGRVLGIMLSLVGRKALESSLGKTLGIVAGRGEG